MPAPDRELAGARPRVLIVDDDHDIRESLIEVLVDSGYDAVGAAHGQAALEELERQPAAAILLDLMMPVMDGWAFREAQRERPELAGIPVIVISADTHVPEKAEALNAEGHLVKPVHIKELLELLDRLAR